MKSIKESLKQWLLPSNEDQEIVEGMSNVLVDEKDPPKKRRKAPRVFLLMNYSEAQEIAHYLLLKQPVIVNVGHLVTKDKYRVVDFLSGVIYVLDGQRLKLDANIYLFSPQKRP